MLGRNDIERIERSLASVESGAMIDEADRAFCAGLETSLRARGFREVLTTEEVRLHSDLIYLAAYFAYIDGDASTALDLFEEAATSSERSGHTARHIECLRGVAICHEYAGRQAESIDAVFRCLELAEELGEPYTLSRALSGLTVLYESQGAYDAVYETAMRINEIAQETSDGLLLARAAAYVALSCGYLGRGEEGLEWVERGIRACDDLGDSQIRTYLKLYEFFLLHVAGRIDEAVVAAEVQLEKIAELPAQNAAATYVDVAEIYLSAGRFSRAADMLSLADKAAKSDDLKAHLIKYYAVAADLYEARGETAMALQMLRSHGTLHEQLRGSQARARLVTVERHSASVLAQKTAEIHEHHTRQLLNKNEQLEQLNRQKDEILNVVAHDLRSPLAAAQMLSESLLLDAGSFDADHRQQVQSIQLATTEMGATIDTLLDIQRGHPDRVMEPVDAILERSLLWLGDAAAERAIGVEVDLEPVPLQADTALLQRSLDDILWLRLQATEEGGLLSISATSQSSGATLVITSSSAVPVADQRALYIARRLVERMAGSIDVSTLAGPTGLSTTTTIELRNQ